MKMLPLNRGIDRVYKATFVFAAQARYLVDIQEDEKIAIYERTLKIAACCGSRVSNLRRRH